MEITKIRYQLSGKKYPLAVCSVVLDDCLKLDKIKLCEGSKGKYIMYPEKPKDLEKEDGHIRRNEYFHPIKKDFAIYLESAIIEGYKKLTESGSFEYSLQEGGVTVNCEPQRNSMGNESESNEVVE